MRKTLTSIAEVLCIALCAFIFGACADKHPEKPPKEPVEIIVSFDSRGGSVCAPVKYKDTPIALPTPERNGYDFSGWYILSDASGNAVTTPYTPTADITLYAGWTEKHTPPDPPEQTDPVISGEYSYDIFVGGDINVDIDLKGGVITSVTLDGRDIDDYSLSGGKLVIGEMYLFGTSGEIALEVTTDKGDASAVISVFDSSVAPSFVYGKYVYDLAIGGELDMKLDSFCEIVYVKIDGETVKSDRFTYSDGKLLLAFDAIADIGVGEYSVTAVTSLGSASASLYVINTVKTSFATDILRNYEYGKTEELIFDAGFDNVTITSLTRKCVNDAAPVTVDPEAYSYENGEFTVNDKILDRIYGTTEFTVTLSNSDKYKFTVNSNVLFYTDYDVTTIHDGALYINSIPEIAQTPNGNVLRFMGVGKTSPSYTYAIRNSRLENTNWYGMEIPSGKYVTVDFDYSVHDVTGENNYVFTYIDGSGTAEKSLPLGNGENRHWRITLPTDNLRVICVNTLTHDGESYMDIDNFRITLVDKVPQGGVLSEYNNTTGGDLSIPFDSKYAVQDVKIDGVSVAYSYADNTLTIGQDTLPEEVGQHTITVETAVYDIVYTLVITSDDYKVTLDKTSFDYKYGIDGDLRITGTYGQYVSVTSLTRKSKHDVAPLTVDAGMYAFDTTNGLTVKAALAEKLYGSTEFVMTASGVEYTFTVNSNVLFYTDYDVTTIHDGALYINSIPEIAQTPNGNVLRFMGVGKTSPSYTYAIRNSRLENTNWYGMEIPSGKYVTVDFDYSVHDVTGENNYVFTYIDGSGTAEKSLPLGNGENRHWRITLPTDNLRVICVNTLTHDGESYMDIDNFRITLIDSVPPLSKQLPDYCAEDGNDMTIEFPTGGLELTEVTVDGVETDYTYENGNIVLSATVLPISIGVHKIEISTRLYTAVYTVNSVAPDTNIVLDKAVYDYVYGSSDLRITGTYGQYVSVTSLTRKSKHDVAPLTVDAGMYAFDTTNGLTVKAALAEKLYGSTEFVMTASGVEYTFTVNSNVLFYTDYDVTTIHDGALYVNSNGSYEIVQTDSGKALRFMGAGKANLSYIYQIRNSLRESSLWYGLEIPAGKYVTVEFDYSVHDVTGNNNYVFTSISNGQASESSLELGDGERHARFVLPTDVLNVMCVNTVAHDGTSYMDIDNFRITLTDVAPVNANALNAANTVSARTECSGYGEYDVIGGKKTLDFSDERQKNEFDLYSVTGNMPYISEGKFVTLPYAKEQKMIYRFDLSGDMAVSVDIAPIAANYMIDGGIYLNARGASDGTDQIIGLCLNAEKVTGADKYWLKLYEFDNRYVGMLKEVELIYGGNEVHIQAVIKSGTLYAFADGALAFAYEIPDYTGGRVGLRSFYAANRFDNFTVVSGDFAVDTAVLDSLRTKFVSLDGDKYFAEGYNSLKAAVDALIEAPTSQTYIDRNVKNISELFDALEEKRTKSELDELAATCAAIDENCFTTRNSYLSMRSLIERAKTATGEIDISELYKHMTFLKDNAAEVKA